MSLGVAVFMLIGFHGTAQAQDNCQATCRSSDGPCVGKVGAAFKQCVDQCVRACPKPTPRPTPTPRRLLDPGCTNRSITGKINCTIERPAVNAHETSYPNILFAPKDIVEVKADGCVQTGGHGNTWKRYVNPSGPESGTKYHGLIRIPTATPAGGGLVRINTLIGKRQTVTGTGVPLSQLFLSLGYEDSDYSDNSYDSHDDGTDDQCKITPTNDGGPAHVTITIYRDVPPDTTQSRFDWDVLSDTYDPNGLPYQPQWSWQQKNPGQIPNTSMCHNFSTRGSTLGIPDVFLSPSFSDCTDQADASSVDQPIEINSKICAVGGLITSDSFAGHVNWFPITVEGHAGWGDHGWQDDDYTFNFRNDNPGNPLSINGRTGLHIEFDSDETIDNFKSLEWANIRGFVDAGNKAAVSQHFDGHTILTGMFGLDGEHGMKAELHPLFALATKRDNYENDPKDEVWLMFVRNRGDEGFCSAWLWDLGLEDYTFHLPWLQGMTSVDVDWTKTKFDGTDGTTPPVVTWMVPSKPNDPAAGVYVTFHLGPAASSPYIDGALHLVWTGQAVGTVRTAVAKVQAPVEGDDDVEQKLNASVNKLTPQQQQQIKAARRSVVVGAKPPTHALAAGPPARRITSWPVLRKAGKPHAIKAGSATRKSQRDAAVVRALCAQTKNAPPGLPADVCKAPAR